MKYKQSFIGHYVGEVVKYKGHEDFIHECVITHLWEDPDNGKSGVTIKPTGDYGFEIDLYEDQLNMRIV